ncbi:hypothetical protein G9A89_008273 [Geosiphon pyriformis]|nr:hypothetical protein G9A89_008273 [Geosiphon pyriformis]
MNQQGFTGSHTIPPTLFTSGTNLQGSGFTPSTFHQSFNSQKPPSNFCIGNGRNNFFLKSQQQPSIIPGSAQVGTQCNHHHWVCRNCGAQQECIQCKKNENKPSLYLEEEEQEEKYFEPVIINAALNGRKRSKTGFTPDRWHARPIREMDLTIMVPPTKTLDDLLEEIKRDNLAEGSLSENHGIFISNDSLFSESSSSSQTNFSKDTDSTVELLSPETSFIGENMRIDVTSESFGSPNQTFASSSTDRSFGFNSMAVNQSAPLKKKTTAHKPPTPDPTYVPEVEMENSGMTGNAGMFFKNLWGCQEGNGNSNCSDECLLTYPESLFFLLGDK